MRKLKCSFLLVLSLLSIASISVAQTCNDNISESAAGIAFTVASGGNDIAEGEVLDTRTKLIWQRCSIGQQWSSAQNDCLGEATKFQSWGGALSVANGEWRLPNIKELNSIVEVACMNPSTNSNIFPSTRSDRYWSSTPYVVANGKGMYYIGFNTGWWSTQSANAEGYVRLVRDES